MAWKSNGRPVVSRADVVGMGGLFLHTSNPPPLGALIELLFELKTGDVRARACVRDSLAGKGMGLQFVQMQPDDRARLTQFLSQFDSAASQHRDTTSGEITGARKPQPSEVKKAPQPRKLRSVRRCALVASTEVVDLSSGTRLSARISELAVRGCYVDALNPFPEGTQVKIRILRDGGTFEAKAKVVYCHAASGMGLTFTQIAPAQRALLEDWLAEVITLHRTARFHA